MLRPGGVGRGAPGTQHILSMALRSLIFEIYKAIEISCYFLLIIFEELLQVSSKD